MADALFIQLLGRPSLEIDGTSGYRYRSRKSWAVLAFLLLGERPPTRSQLASLLFAEADDPLRALRWSLAEIRKGLVGCLLDGDPVQLTLPVGARVDVDVLVHGHWRDAVDLPGLWTFSTVSPSRTRHPSSRGCSRSGVGSRRLPSRSCTRPRWGPPAESSSEPVTSPSGRP